MSKQSTKVKVVNLHTNELLTFESLNEASVSLHISKVKLRKILDENIIIEYKEYRFIPFEDSIVEDSSNVNDTNKYVFDTTSKQYKWTSIKLSNGGSVQVEYVLDLEAADKLFFEYSKYGLNMSALEVRINNNISIAKWNSLQNRFQLYKESDIFSPVSRESMSDEEYVNFVNVKLKEQQDYRRRAVVKQYDKYQVKEAEKLSKIAFDKRFVVESILSEMSEWLIERPHKEVIITKSNEIESNEAVIAIADLHIGAEIVKSYRNQDNFSSKILRSNLDKIAAKINASNYSDVTLLICGDLIHSFTGTMHKSAFKSMEHKMYGAKLIKLAVEILEEFISKIANVRKVAIVSGNHDRYSDDYKSDSDGEIAEIIMYILKRTFSDKIEFLYDPYLVSFDNSEIRYIMLHGNTKSVYKSEAIVHDYGDQDKFNLILSAHLHTRGVLLDTTKCRHVLIPSLFTKDDYALRAGYSSVPGFLVIENHDQIPQILDVSIV